jgi:hypothetical protein
MHKKSVEIDVLCHFQVAGAFAPYATFLNGFEIMSAKNRRQYFCD